MTSPVPPAPEEGAIDLWRNGDSAIFTRGSVDDNLKTWRPGAVAYRALPAAAYDAMEAKASAYPDAMDLIRSLAGQLAEAESRLAAAEKAREEAVVLLKEARRYVEDNIAGRFVPSNGDAATLLSRIDAALGDG